MNKQQIQTWAKARGLELVEFQRDIKPTSYSPTGKREDIIICKLRYTAEIKYRNHILAQGKSLLLPNDALQQLAHKITKAETVGTVSLYHNEGGLITRPIPMLIITDASGQQYRFDLFTMGYDLKQSRLTIDG